MASIEERIAILENQTAQLVSFCQGLLKASQEENEMFIESIEARLILFKWQKDISMIFSECDALDESARLAFKSFADVAGLNYERIEAPFFS